MDQEEFDIFVTRGLALWLEIISDWVTHAADLHIIFYEVISACNIHSNIGKQLTKLCRI